VQDRLKESGVDIPTALTELTKTTVPIDETRNEESEAPARETPSPADEKAASEVTSTADDNETPVEVMSDDKLYEGVFNLEIKPPVEFSQLMTLRKYLSRVPDLKLVSSAGFVDGDVAKTVYVIELRHPCALIKILEDLPGIESISQQKRDILISLV
jgi:hypothetical protein